MVIKLKEGEGNDRRYFSLEYPLFKIIACFIQKNNNNQIIIIVEERKRKNSQFLVPSIMNTKT